MLGIQACRRALLPGMGQNAAVSNTLCDVDDSDLTLLRRNLISAQNWRLLFSFFHNHGVTVCVCGGL